MKKKTLMILIPLFLLAIGCNQKNSDEPMATPANSYGLVNGSCFDYSRNVYVTSNLCTSQYYWSNGSCYSVNGQIVNANLCSMNTSTTAASQCYGSYIYSNYGQMQMVTCAGVNCRGYTLIEAASGRQVSCQ